MKIEKDTIQALGVYVGRNNDEKQKRNFEDKYPAIKQYLHIFSCRDISIKGRMLITKTFRLSERIYPLTYQEIQNNQIYI